MHMFANFFHIKHIGLCRRQVVLVLFFVDFFWVVDFFCDKIELFAAVFLQRTVKTGLVTYVALAGIDGYFKDQAVLVTIDEYLFHFLDVAAFFAFLPQFLL